MFEQHTTLQLLPYQHLILLALNELDQSIDALVGNDVKRPDESAHDQNTGQDDQGVLQHLLGGRPYDLLQLAAKLAEVSADAAQGSLEPVCFLCFCHFAASLLGLVVNGVLSAESAVLLHFETVRVILLVFHGVVVSLLALGASQSDFHAHNGTSLNLPPCITPASEKFS